MLPAEALWRFGIFAAVLLLLLAWEQRAPRRQPAPHRISRRLNNLALLLAGNGLLRLIVPLAAVGAAAWAQARGLGLFNLVALPVWFAIPATVVLLDLGLYLQHRLFHAVPLLWRLHRVHHADPDFDVTTALRFHPLELAVSLGIKLALVVALGAPPLAVLLFEVLLNALAMFNHANIAMPDRLERALRRIIVTPDLHRVHHSVRAPEQQRNFGFGLVLWDRLFDTCQAQPAGGHIGMAIGQPAWRSPRDQWLDRLLLNPLKADPQRQREGH